MIVVQQEEVRAHHLERREKKSKRREGNPHPHTPTSLYLSRRKSGILDVGFD